MKAKNFAASEVFAALAVAGVVILRIREPQLERPYRVSGCPVTPLASGGLMVWMIWNPVELAPGIAVAGASKLLLGGALYAWFERNSATAA